MHQQPKEIILVRTSLIRVAISAFFLAKVFGAPRHPLELGSDQILAAQN